MTVDSTPPPTNTTISTSQTDNDVSVVSASSSGANSYASPVPASPGGPLSKSKSFKTKEAKRGLMSSLRRSSSVKKMADTYGSIKSKAVSKGFIQKSHRKVPKKSESKPKIHTSIAAPISVKEVDVGEQSQAANSVNEECGSKFDEETYFNVEFDSLPAGMEAPMDTATTTGASVKENATTIVLLLLDGRRFELLQLEMNPKTASIEDILNQIPMESTDKTLRDQKYVAVCDANGAELEVELLVGDYFPSDLNVYYVAMAIPDTMTREEVVKFSKPIFSSTNISTMFKGSKKEGNSTTQTVPKTEETTDTAASKTEETTDTAAPKTKEATDTAAPKTNETTDTAASTIKVTTATVPKTKETAAAVPAIKETNNAAPKEKETTDTAAVPQAAKKIKKELSFKNKIFGKKTEEKNKETKAEDKKLAKQSEEKTPPKRPEEKKQDIKKKDMQEKTKSVVADTTLSGTDIVSIKAGESKPSSSNYFLAFSILAVVFSIIPIFIVLQHEQFYSPLTTNQELKVGQWRSSCGLFRFLPDPYNHCDSILLKMNEGGSLTLSNENTNTTYWEMRSFANCDEDCSAVVTEGGIVEIGGEPAALISTNEGNPEFSAPWPFGNERVASSWPFAIDVNMKPKRRKIRAKN